MYFIDYILHLSDNMINIDSRNKNTFIVIKRKKLAPHVSGILKNILKKFAPQSTLNLNLLL